jgi:large subunit ribosomal protein L9
MDVILLERIEKLGQMGDVVSVKNGFARNFLLPTGRALRATKTNLERFETERVDLEARNLERRGEAEIVGMRMDGAKVVLVRQASDMGQLYGSVSARDIAEGLIEGGYNVERRQVVLDRAIKTLGLHPVRVMLHPEVTITVEANVARTVEEAERQEAGIFFDDPDQDELDELEGEAEALFEPADDAAASEEAHGEETEGEEAVRAAVSDEKTVTPA